MPAVFKDFAPGYSAQNFSYMKQFYLSYTGLLEPNQIFRAVRGKSDAPSRISAKLTIGPEILHAARGESWQPGRLHQAEIRRELEMLRRNDGVF